MEFWFCHLSNYKINHLSRVEPVIHLRMLTPWQFGWGEPADTIEREVCHSPKIPPAGTPVFLFYFWCELTYTNLTRPNSIFLRGNSCLQWLASSKGYLLPCNLETSFCLTYRPLQMNIFVQTANPEEFKTLVSLFFNHRLFFWSRCNCISETQFCYSS